MIVSEAIDLLVEAELKQLSLKSDKAKILGFINSAILELYKRFNLWEGNALITMVTGTSLYKMDGIDPNVNLDLTDHFFLMIEEVWLISNETGVKDKKLLMNEERDEKGVATLKYNEITTKEVLNARVLKVVYRAAPLFLLHEKAEIPLPMQFNEALFNYVGYRAHGSVKGDTKSENNTHYIRFEASVERIKTDGLHPQDDMDSSKFNDRGFV